MTKEVFDKLKSPFLVSLDDLSACDPSRVGAKAHSLAKMVAEGILVPRGFIITAEAYDRYKDDSIPDSLKQEIEQQCRKLGFQRVAVRSSSLVHNLDIGEDSKEYSWAGVLTTHLNVFSEEVINQIEDCWKSIQKPEALVYMTKLGLTPSQLRMGVIVQEMIDGDMAGVADSIDYDNSQFMLVEAAPGLGDRVVSGEITPDQYYVHRETASIAAKKTEFQGGGKELQLTDQLILDLFRQVNSLEAIFGYPVDVEWVAKEGLLYITQCRPLVGLDQASTVDADTIFQRLLYPKSWSLRVTRPWSIFRTSLLCNASNSPILRLHNIHLTDFINVQEQVPGSQENKLHHFWQSSQMASLFEGLRQFPETYPDLLNQFLQRAPEYNSQAKKFLKDPKKAFRNLEDALSFFYNLAVLGTIIPHAVLESNRSPVQSVKYSKLMEFCEELRTVSYHPEFTDKIVAPLAKRRIRDLGLKDANLAYLTINEILTGNIGSVDFRLNAAARGKNFTYQYLDGKELVIWLDNTLSLIKKLDSKIVPDNPLDIRELSGLIGYPGYCEGLARVVLTYDTSSIVLKDGDIIVTINGNPNLIRLMERSAGIVCDEGGMTSHIARLARELRKPCIMGTKYATSIIKDDDYLIEDANQGLVKIQRK